MSDNCLNIFPRSSLFFYLFYPSTNKFPPSRSARRKNTYFTYNIIIIIADPSRCDGKKYSHLYLMSFFLLIRQEIFCLLSHRIMFTFIAGEYFSLSSALFDVQCFQCFSSCYRQHGTFHNLQTYPPFLTVLPLWTDANHYSCGYFSVIKEEKRKEKHNKFAESC